MFLGLFGGGGDGAFRVLARTTKNTSERIDTTSCTNNADEPCNDVLSEASTSDLLSSSSTLVDDGSTVPDTGSSQGVEDFPAFDAAVGPAAFDLREGLQQWHDEDALESLSSSNAPHQNESDAELWAELDAEVLEAEIAEEELEALLSIPLAASLLEVERRRAYGWGRLFGQMA